MATLKRPSEGGSGGKRGHSGMEHWEYTEEIKDASRSRRRSDDDRLAEEGKAEYDDEKPQSRDTDN